MTLPFTAAIDPDISDNPRFTDLVAYWHQKRGERALPLDGGDGEVGAILNEVVFS